VPDSGPPKDDNAWDDLIVSILSVNQYSLEKTFAVLGALRAGKITDPTNLARWTHEEMTDNLKSSGCNRGAFMTGLFAQRLCSVGELIRTKGIAHCESVLISGDRRMIEELLLPVNGIGPKVLQNFFLLRPDDVARR
jgi:hypothetical protein